MLKNSVNGSSKLLVQLFTERIGFRGAFPIFLLSQTQQFISFNEFIQPANVIAEAFGSFWTVNPYYFDDNLKEKLFSLNYFDRNQVNGPNDIIDAAVEGIGHVNVGDEIVDYVRGDEDVDGFGGDIAGVGSYDGASDDDSGYGDNGDEIDYDENYESEGSEWVVVAILEHEFEDEASEEELDDNEVIDCRRYLFHTAWENDGKIEKSWEPLESFIDRDGVTNEVFNDYCSDHHIIWKNLVDELK